jgi:hypothetical protein
MVTCSYTFLPRQNVVPWQPWFLITRFGVYVCLCLYVPVGMQMSMRTTCAWIRRNENARGSERYMLTSRCSFRRHRSICLLTHASHAYMCMHVLVYSHKIACVRTCIGLCAHAFKPQHTHTHTRILLSTHSVSSEVRFRNMPADSVVIWLFPRTLRMHMQGESG